MKRFFCKQCQRVMRVRVMPPDVKEPHTEVVTNRVGTCRWHQYPNQRLALASRQPTRQQKKPITVIATKVSTSRRA